MIVAEVGEAIKIDHNYGNQSYRPRNGGYQSNNRYNDRSNYRRETLNQDYGQRNRNRSVRQTNVRTIISQSFHEG